MPLSRLGGFVTLLDPNAIHVNTAGEIDAIAEKVLPANADLLVIEDSAAGNAKKKVQVGNLPAGGGGGLGYTLAVQGSSFSPLDSETRYFGNLPMTPATAQGRALVYIPVAGTIKIAEIWSFAGTPGTNEDWSMYIRLNNATDTLIQTLGVAVWGRRWSNAGLSIAVVPGDYIEIKMVCPVWATNPATVFFGGHVYIE